MKYRSASRTVDMVALPGYVQLLRRCRHRSETFTITGVEMKKVQIAAAKHIFNHTKKSKKIAEHVAFNTDIVNRSDIKDGDDYYSGFLFVPKM